MEKLNGGSANAPKAEQSRAKALPVPFWEQRTYTVPHLGYCCAPLQGACAAVGGTLAVLRTCVKT